MSDPLDWDYNWEKMETGFNKLVVILEKDMTKGFGTIELMGLYTIVYNMCVLKAPTDHSDELYQGYGDLVRSYLTTKVAPSLKAEYGVFLLRKLDRSWKNHKVMYRWLSKFFEYLERYHIPRHALPSLKQLAFSCFREKVYGRVNVKVTDAILNMIDQERAGEQIDRAIVKDILSMFIDLGPDNNPLELYQTDFEAFMIENTIAHYSRKASIHMEEDSCADYLLMTEESLKKERERVAHYLHSSTESKLIEKTQHVLLFGRVSQILEKENSGLEVLLREKKVEDLSRVYRLLSKIDKGLEPVLLMFKQHVQSTGIEFVQAAQEEAKTKKAEGRGNTGFNEVAFAEAVIGFHDRYLSYCKNCFMNDPNFEKALEEVFEVFLNTEIAGTHTAEILSTFCDNILRKGSALEKSGDNVIEETIAKVIRLLGYIQDKDLFAEFSRTKLARRLIGDRSSNIEYEKLLLSKLKQQFGVHFTSKMEGMITDLSLAKEMQVEFESYLRDNPDETLGIDVNVSVLTTGFWPITKWVEFNVPAEFVCCMEAFKLYYKAKTKNRKLNWIFTLGNCIVIGRFGSKTFELILSSYQAAALLLFNTADRLSFREIANQLKLPREETFRVLHSLSCGRYKILIKEPNSRVVSESDVFEFNNKFTDVMKRIKVPLPHFEERKRVSEDIPKSRNLSIDAALVRIMKSRKVLSHQQLVVECIKMLSSMFKPDMKDIKKRIEQLIYMEYMERDKENANTYKYLA